jgi:hypothetical protein
MRKPAHYIHLYQKHVILPDLPRCKRQRIAKEQRPDAATEGLFNINKQFIQARIHLSVDLSIVQGIGV